MPTLRKKKPKLDPELLAAAIVAANGNLASVARKFECARSYVVEFVSMRPNLSQVLKDAREGMTDMVESRFYADCLKDGPQYQTSRIFYLKTKGKHRGWVEREKDPPPPPVEQIIDTLSPELADAVRAALRARTGATLHPGADSPGDQGK